MRIPLQLACLTAAAALALPGVAQAAFTSVPVGNVVTLTGDATNETLVIGHNAAGDLTHNQTTADFASATDFNTAMAGTQTLPADGSITVVVDSGGGDDAITVNATIATTTLTGGAGDDTLTAPTVVATNDTLNGGDDDDRLTGGRGDDLMDGDAGNDQAVWNNGDNTDVIEGDTGNDETEVNGAVNAGDAFTVNPNGARADFDRTNLVPFSLDIGTTERLTVNGGGGNDTITGAAGLAALPILLGLHGGPGTDAITGGDGPDLITGGEDADTLNGGGAADRIVGDRGGDTFAGGPGDDTLVWNNGDGSDVMDGQDGLDRTEVNGSPTAGDTFTVSPNGARVDFDRTNLVAFSLDIGTTELLAVNGLGGDDSVTVQPGAVILTTADGGAGNDTLTGAEQSETLAGGSGNDVITGGEGADLLDGHTGDDTLLARDGAGDVARCGEGADAVQGDFGDVLEACESTDLTAAPAPPPSPPAAATTTGGAAVVQGAGQQAALGDVRGLPVDILTGGSRFVRRGSQRTARIGVRCPAAETGGCTGLLTLTTASRVGSSRLVAVLGSARFTLQPGQRRTVVVRLGSGAARLLRNRRSFAVRASALSRDRAGNLAERTRRLSLPIRSR